MQGIGLFQSNLQWRLCGTLVTAQMSKYETHTRPKESNNSSIKLPESERTIEVLLDEIYDAYNATTGSLFTGFALRSDMEKERLLNDLLDLFVAADKVCLA